MSETQQPAPFQPLVFEGFTGLNTDASRPGIKDTEAFVLDGFMPIGDSQARAIPDIGPEIFTTPTDTTIGFYAFGNIARVPYAVIFPSDGSIWLVNTDALTDNEIAPAGTITTPTAAQAGITQWGSQFIIIVANQTNGYFITDGTIFYQAGSIAPTTSASLTSGGSGYTSVPSYTVYGGSGSGVVLTPVLTEGSVTSLVVNNPGSGYLPGDVVQVAFSGGGSDSTPILEAVLSVGVVEFITLISGGSGYPDGTFPLAFSGGGGGSGANGTFTVSGDIVTSIDLTAGGANYTGSPAIAFPIPGSGGAITATLSGTAVNALAITNGGSGYVPGTYPLAFSGGGGTGATAIYTVNSSGVIASTLITAGGTGYTSDPTVIIPTGSGAVAVASITPGSVASINIINGGTNLIGTPLLTIVGGEGIGATAVATVDGGVITGVSVTNGGSGYITDPAVEVQAGLNNAASAILDVMPFGIQGTAAETYQSRVWVVGGNPTAGDTGQVQFTAPQSYTDFSTANGGGSFQSNDSFLRVAYIIPIQTNGFLYFIADSSVNYIGGVTTSGNPVVTSFTNQNADPEVGTPYAATVETIGSNVVFANAFGAQVSYGGQVTKISKELDGIYATVPNFGGFQPSAAKHILFGKRVWILLIPIIDQVTGQQVNKLCMWDQKRWWTSNQGVALTFISSQEIASILTAYGTDGTKIYPLFNTPSANFTKTAQSKLWAKPGGYATAKSSNRVWVLAQYNSATSPDLTIDIDNETGVSQTITLTPASPTTGIYVSPPTATGQNGALLGMTISTQAADVTLISATIDSVPVGYRG